MSVISNEQMKRKSYCNCRRLVTHCWAAIIHSKGFITKLLLVNTLIIQCRSHARIVTQLFAMCTQARHARTHARHMDNNVDKRNRTISHFVIIRERWRVKINLHFFPSLSSSSTRLHVHRTKLWRLCAPLSLTQKEKELIWFLKPSVPLRRSIV